MKHLSFRVTVAIAVIILSIISCKKETTVQTFPPPPYQPFSVDLVADNWIKICDPQYTHFGECSFDHQMYTDNLQDVLNSSNLNCRCTIKVYLVIDSKEILLNDTPIQFMGNELYATVNLSNIEITYKSSAYGLPFTSLKIRVVGE
jgi:hypothetical protein